tara:strand:+ start:892 stop:1818 length:927 start_codon:yes stop_codon:yes gene_type:complete
MKALVTGGCGFIGSNLVDDLVSSGHRVEVIDDLSAVSNNKFYYNDKASYHKVDILNEEKINDIFKSFSPNVVFHLAAKSRIQTTIENPLLCCDVNFKGTANILEMSKIHGVDRVIFSSTSSTYGLKNECPLREDMRKDCLNPYSVSKSGAEDLCKMYNDLYSLKTITFRYFNVYGQRQPLKGQYAPVIGIFYRQKANAEPMTVVGDGLQTRDYTNVSDVVRANILALETNDDQVFGEIFNVGSGTSYSVLDICNMIGGQYKHIPERIGEVRETLADISKIRKMLGYQPTIKLEDWINEENLKYGEEKK